MKIDNKISSLTCVIIFLIVLGVIYCSPTKKPHYAEIPIYHHPSTSCPIVNIEIESKLYRMSLDTGSTHSIALHKEMLDLLSKKESTETVTFIDINGNQYTKPQFKIPKIKISNLEAGPILILQENKTFLTTGSYIGPINTFDASLAQERMEYINGRIGMDFLKNFSVYLDFPNSIICIAENEDELKKNKNIHLANHIEVPLSLNESLIIFRVETDYGIKRFLVDTDFEHSIWNDIKVSLRKKIKTNDFSINGVNFGPQTFFTYKIPKEFDCDGILGIDFLKNHSVFIDVRAKKALISSPNIKNTVSAIAQMLFAQE